MSHYIEFRCPTHGDVDVDSDFVGCPECGEDHLRKEKIRAQIAALEEISEYYGHTTRDMAQAKIAALRKELGQ